MTGFPVGLPAAIRIDRGVIGPDMFTQPAAPPVQNLPVESARTGSTFADRVDPALSWYLPAFTLATPDPWFAFAAAESGVDASTGNPFDSATVTLTIAVGEPADLASARAASPQTTFRQIPVDGLTASLSCPAKDSSGNDATVTTSLVASAAGQSLTLTGTLVGPAVVVAYQALAHDGDASITLNMPYSVWRSWRPAFRFPGLGALEGLQPVRTAVAATPVAVTDVPLRAAGPPAAAAGARDEARMTLPIGIVPVRPIGPVPIDPPPEPTWVTATDTQTTTLSVGNMYAADSYRPWFTIAAAGSTRPIIDASDLTTFASARSEFRELTSLGDVGTRYPSLRRLYLGQVSGAVVAIPQAYAILRSSTGLAAALEALLDDSPTSVSGCRFQFTFILSPMVDPADLAQLAIDLATTPEAATQTLHLTLPDGLDPRGPSALGGFSGGVADIADGTLPNSVRVAVGMTDELGAPAASAANMFLNQLAGQVSPMTGTLAVRLDDLYPTPVTTAFVLQLAQTAGSDDLSLVAGGQPGEVTAQNAGPLDLRLSGTAAVTPTGVQRAQIDVVLAAGTTTTLAPDGGTPASMVRAQLALPDPLPHSALFGYVSVHTETVSQIQHPLAYNASLDFAAAGIVQLDVAASLTALPAVGVPSVTLTAAHPVDSVHALIPVDAVVTGLLADLAVTVTPVTGAPWQVLLHNDFVADPILIITAPAVAKPG